MIIVVLVLSVLLSALCLWVGLKITKIEGSFGAMLIVAGVSGGLGMIPYVGWLLGLVAMFILICTLTEAEFWPDAVLLVFVAKGVGFLLGLALAGMLSAGQV